MSRMTRFLKQGCQLALASRDAKDKPILDNYGAAVHESAETVKCRREEHIQFVVTATGQVATSNTTYYLDNTTVIRVGDRLDGCEILAVGDFINGKGGNEGYKCLV